MQLLARREDGTRILRIESQTDAEPWKAAFAGAYQAIWSEPPYNERFFPDEAEAILRRNLQNQENHSILAVRDSGVVAGFAFASPLVAHPVVYREVRGIVPIEHTFYFSELGVLERYRGQGLGKQLIDLRLSLIPRNRYHNALLRLSAVRDSSYELYRAMGFEDTGVYTEVASRRNDGVTRTDRRVYLSMVL